MPGEGSIKGKRFLITQPMIQEIVGSTMAAIELADYLASEGAEVTIYTHYLAEPASKKINNKVTRVLDDPNSPQLRLVNFDYIWVHSQVIPEAIARQLGEPLPQKMPIFIYLHMSIMDWLPDEKSYIWMLEENTSSKTLFAWKEVEEKNLKDLLAGSTIDHDIYQNPAPKAFSQLKDKPRMRLKNILLIGNQLPKEVIELQEILNTNGYNAVRFSSSGNKYDTISAQLLSKYDLVITGSKSAYYCLCAGVPVYIYNYFGCEGYINDTNLEESIERNFSGRGYEMKPAEWAYGDIVSNFKEAAKFYAANRSMFIELFSIDKVLPRILSSIKQKKFEQFDAKYGGMVLSNAILSNRLFFNENERIRLQKYVSNVTSYNDQLKNDNDNLRHETNLAAGRISNLENELVDITQSKSWKVTKPLRAAGKVKQLIAGVIDELKRTKH